MKIDQDIELAATTRGVVEVSNTGGKFGGGYIKNFSIIKVGPAKGHGLWCDQFFLDQIAAAFDAEEEGIRSRYTHPGPGESLSRGLGRVFLTSREPGQLRGELHFWKAARSTPHGDLASHTIQLAADDASALGCSIAFGADRQETMEADIDNEFDYPHVRLSALKFVDIVDSPAANPDGLFSSTDSVDDVIEIQAVGLTNTKSGPSVPGVDLQSKVEEYRNFLFSQGYETVKLNLKDKDATPEVELDEAVVDVEAPVVEPVAEVEAEPVAEAEAVVEPATEGGHFPAPAEPEKSTGGHFSREDLAAYVTEFGKADGVDYFMDGLDFQSAQSKYIKKLKDENKGLRDQIQLSSQTEDIPFSSGSGETTRASKPGLKNRIKVG